MLKKIMTLVAAFAVTATTAAAFQETDWSELTIDLDDSEISALEKVDEIREAAHTEAKAVLEAAGIDNERMHEIHNALHKARAASHEGVRTAIEAHDYEAFQAAIAGSPLADTITSEEKFERLVEAHELRKSGDNAAARAIMDELGIDIPHDRRSGPGGHHRFGNKNLD
jgi:hypothetical protein